MACKRSAVRSRLPPPRIIMKLFGIISVWLGIIVSVVGLVVGFAKLPSGDETDAMPWLSLIPVGFALMMFGIAATQLSNKK